LSRIFIDRADYLVTMDDNRTVIPGGSLLIEDNRITALGLNLTPPPDARVIEGSGKLVFPGFVNTHHHLYQILTRNLPFVQDAKLFDWLIGLYEIWRELTAEAVRVSTLVGVGELLLTGCTLTTDMFYVFPRGVEADLIGEQVRAAAEAGIRFHPCRGSMSCGRSEGGLPPDEVVQDEDYIEADCRQTIERYHDPSPLAMTRIALGPCSPFSVSADSMRRTVQMARELEVRIHTHLAETKDEEAFCLEKFGMRPFAYMRSLGWLGPQVWFAHCVHLDNQEIKEMASTGTGVAHCPVSNLRLGSGIAPVPAMLEAGVPVGLAVDGSASNDAGDMLGELRVALLAHRVGSDVSSMPASDVLWMATRGGARVLGWENEVGSLEPNKAADVVLFDWSGLEFAGARHDPMGALLFCGHNHRVHTSIVNGRLVVEAGRLLTIDVPQVGSRADRISAEMMERAAARTGIDYLKHSDGKK